MKKYRYEVILFIVNIIYMILELVASRVLSPYFGNSNFVWTSVIGIILLSSSIGNYIGGVIADKKELNKKLKMILLVSFVFVIIIPFLQNSIISNIAKIISDIRIGAILSTIILFFAPSLFFGTLTPIILKLKLDSLDTVGIISGKIYATATIGGIIGTFLGGFFLVPNFGSVQILFVLAIILFLLIPIVDFKLDIKAVIIGCIIIGICLFIMIFNINQNQTNGTAILNGEQGKFVSYDTQYGRVLIYNQMRDDDLVRVLNIDSGYESACFVDESKYTDLVFEYTQYYDLMFKANKEIKDTLLIGGAGYSYPKHFISKNLDKNMDVVEIDGEITKIAKEYFGLDKLIDEYNLEETKRLNLITDDGRTYLNKNTKKYDAILNDAFSGSSPAETLTTNEAIQKIKASLNEGGLYLTNIISSLEGINSKFLRAEVNTLRQNFKNVYVIPCNYDDNFEIVQNNMVIATDTDIKLDGVYDLKIEQNEIVLTDEFCPVDTLIPKR